MSVQIGIHPSTSSSAHRMLGFGFALIFCGALQEAAAFLAHLLGQLATQFLQLLPCLFPAIWRLLGAQAPDMERFAACFHLLSALFPLLRCLLALR